MRYPEKFEAYDTNAGKYGNRKVPKWLLSHYDIMEYVRTLEKEASGQYYEPVLANSR